MDPALIRWLAPRYASHPFARGEWCGLGDAWLREAEAIDGQHHQPHLGVSLQRSAEALARNAAALERARGPTFTWAVATGDVSSELAACVVREMRRDVAAEVLAEARLAAAVAVVVRALLRAVVLGEAADVVTDALATTEAAARARVAAEAVARREALAADGAVEQMADGRFVLHVRGRGVSMDVGLASTVHADDVSYSSREATGGERELPARRLRVPDSELCVSSQLRPSDLTFSSLQDEDAHWSASVVAASAVSIALIMDAHPSLSFGAARDQRDAAVEAVWRREEAEVEARQVAWEEGVAERSMWEGAAPAIGVGASEAISAWFEEMMGELGEGEGADGG